MNDFSIRSRRDGNRCRGTVLDFGPYPRLVVRVKDPMGEFPSDSVVSRACGEEVMLWVKEIFIRVGDVVAVAAAVAGHDRWADAGWANPPGDET